MATFDELFGKGESGSKRWIKFEQDGEAFLLEQTGEVKLVPQKNQKTGANVWLVKYANAEKYKPMDEGTFDESDEDIDNAFMPQKDIVIPVKVLAKKLKDGSKDPSHEPFDTDWELTVDQRGKFKEAMMDAGVPAEAGTKYVVKRLQSREKPYTYSVKILTED